MSMKHIIQILLGLLSIFSLSYYLINNDSSNIVIATFISILFNCCVFVFLFFKTK